MGVSSQAGRIAVGLTTHRHEAVAPSVRHPPPPPPFLLLNPSVPIPFGHGYKEALKKCLPGRTVTGAEDKLDSTGLAHSHPP